VDAEQAVQELTELSSQITAAVVLGAEGDLVAASPSEPSTAERLADATRELIAAAAEISTEGRGVTRVEVELDEGAIFVVRDGAHTVAATTGPSPTSGLVVYDLRTCAQSIDAPAPRKRRARKAKEEDA
jgi:predicted regulator of Ras-like GTPase activity (Roadblock/LC7/MglB family)